MYIYSFVICVYITLILYVYIPTPYQDKWRFSVSELPRAVRARLGPILKEIHLLDVGKDALISETAGLEFTPLLENDDWPSRLISWGSRRGSLSLKFWVEI